MSDEREETRAYYRTLFEGGHIIGRKALLGFLLKGPDTDQLIDKIVTTEARELPKGYTVIPFEPLVPTETGIAFQLDGDIQATTWGSIVEMEALAKELSILYGQVTFTDIPFERYPGGVYARQATHGNRFVRFALSIIKEDQDEFVGVSRLELGYVQGRRATPTLQGL